MVNLKVSNNDNKIVLQITMEVEFYNLYYKDYSDITAIANNEIYAKCDVGDFTLATARMKSFNA